MRRISLSLILMIAAMLACVRAAAPTTQLEPGDWRLVSLNGVPAQPSDLSRRPWLRFDADSGRVSGNIGCNRASGPFTRAGDTLRFGPIISTKMACADETLNRQEAAFAGALQATTSHRVRGDTLQLLGDSRVLAVLERSK